MTPHLDPSDGEAVGAALVDWLAERHDIRDGLARPLEAATGGFDTHIWFFQVAGSPPSPWDRPLVLRLFVHPDQGPKAAFEVDVHRHLAGAGYPVPEIHASEVDAASIGLPFIVMDRVDGRPMLESLSANPLRAPKLLDLLGDAHARLHRLASDGFPARGTGPFGRRRLDTVRGECEAAGFVEELAWLDEHLPADEPPVPTHNDFHPLNVLVDDDDHAVVIDWTDADLGDRHHDIARTLGVFWAAPHLVESRKERMALKMARGWLADTYLDRYCERFDVDEDRLRYWTAFQSCHGAAQVTAVTTGRAVTRDDAPDRVSAELSDALRERFWSHTR